MKSLHSSSSGKEFAGNAAAVAEAAVLDEPVPPTIDPGGGGGRKNDLEAVTEPAATEPVV